MQVRYVQDARKRPVDLRKMLGPDEGVSLDVCARFEDLSSVADAPFDVLLIDARRADRVALEEDIRTARKYTDAPIVFLTGTESGQIRARGLEAGAEAVLTRRSLTSHLIKEVVERARRRLGSSHIERPAPTSDVSAKSPIVPDLIMERDETVLWFIAVDPDGSVYGAEVGPKDLKKYVKQP